MEQRLREIVRELLRAAARTGQSRLFTAATLVNICADQLEKKAGAEAGQEPTCGDPRGDEMPASLAREL